MPEMKQPLKVFLYHAPADKNEARDLYLRLIKNGVDAWLVKERLLPGQDWKHEIRRAIREADVVVVCLSGQFTQGDFRQKEVQTAFDNTIKQLKDEIFVVPARLEECDRLENLEKWQWVDLFEKAGYEMLIQVLQTRADMIGADIQVKESSLPPASSPDAKHKGPLPEERAADVTQEVLAETMQGILIEGPAVQLQRSTSRRRPKWAAIVALVSLAGMVIASVLGPSRLERWYQLLLSTGLSQLSGSATGKISKPIVKDSPANIIFLIDSSESMQGPRIEIVKSAVSDFVSDLSNDSLVSIIQFDTNVELQLDFTRDHAVASKVVKSISVDVTRPGSCLYDALSAGILESSFASMAEGTKNMIVLLTDISQADLGWNCNAWSMDDVRDLKEKNPFSIFIVQVGDRYGYWDVEHITADIEAPIYSTETEDKLNEALVSISERTPQLDTRSVPPGFLSAKTARGRFASMVFVPPGDFMMGSIGVYLDAFWIDKTEVTNGMYAECVKARKCNSPHSYGSWRRSSYYGSTIFSNYPVIFVSWTDAKDYCTWVGGQLPTEAQWEKAARGTDGRQFPWGNDDPSGLVGFLNYHGQDTTEVGTYPNGASPYGALDMAGNVSEWVADWFSDSYYSNPARSNPSGPDSGQYRVWRGGSWANTSADWIRTYSRTGNLPTDYGSGLGFRCARNAVP